MGIFSRLFTRKNKTTKIPVTPLMANTSNTTANVAITISPVIVNPYTFEFTLEKFKKIIKNPNAADWFPYIYEQLPIFKINTPERVAGFLAQTAHESMDYLVLSENLNYSALGLRKTFPKYFPTIASAKSYAHKPKSIANRVYGGRGNNNTSTDGWTFRGRGLIQLSLRYNYYECTYKLFNDDRLIVNPDLILNNKTVCVKVACWYWDRHNINKYCDKKDIVGMTKAINGGTIGLADRKYRYEKALTILKS